MSRPTVNTHPVASQYQAPTERIIEFGNGAKSMDAHRGGLISFVSRDDNTMVVGVYRCDPGVIVHSGRDDSRIRGLLSQAEPRDIDEYRELLRSIADEYARLTGQEVTS